MSCQTLLTSTAPTSSAGTPRIFGSPATPTAFDAATATSRLPPTPTPPHPSPRTVIAATPPRHRSAGSGTISNHHHHHHRRGAAAPSTGTLGTARGSGAGGAEQTGMVGSDVSSGRRNGGEEEDVPAGKEGMGKQHSTEAPQHGSGNRQPPPPAADEDRADSRGTLQTPQEDDKTVDNNTPNKEHSTETSGLHSTTVPASGINLSPIIPLHEHYRPTYTHRQPPSPTATSSRASTPTMSPATTHPTSHPRKRRRLSPSLADTPDKRTPRIAYTREQDDFIRFVRDDLCSSWATAQKLYNQFWHPDGRGARQIPGLQSRYYRLLEDSVRELKKKEEARRRRDVRDEEDVEVEEEAEQEEGGKRKRRKGGRGEDSIGRPELGILEKTNRRYWWMVGMYDDQERTVLEAQRRREQAAAEASGESEELSEEEDVRDADEEEEAEAEAEMEPEMEM